MQLSDIPFEHLLNKDNLLISLTGRRGSIQSIDTHGSGIFFQTYLTIKWDGADNLSIVKWPQECVNLKVDMKMYFPMCKAYCDAQRFTLEKHKAFWDAVTETSTDVNNNVQDNAVTG